VIGESEQREKFKQYERTGQFDGFGVSTVYNQSSGEKTVNLDSDRKYVLLFDNTAAGMANPDEYDVTVEVEASLGIIQ
jgi:hypothetical protein